ncbi:hypothetical protein GLOTRDRAFT_109557 [Gloeophyllum trabeum ATCC 11539]|uniref:Uncharacterized protein n=1 Tax=Gloeophyllum trabeum (strain ATCC 11539 / FP-39264 / Madison 617) TaxID=670483 RepID=S7RW94_GLOTA|nr:uncharacterized protein GLOTRDRAFT_109557 [Gloeophyllum trabeum ATCC 11539]EPQ59145.1 hypothetical protein GLOTRDRAFT_109557 [Gloeophyllum trabeum ATCC 11539]
MELVHAKLSTIHTQIVKKQYEEAYYALEALTIIQDFVPAWKGLPDALQKTLTDMVYGACLVTSSGS